MRPKSNAVVHPLSRAESTAVRGGTNLIPVCPHDWSGPIFGTTLQPGSPRWFNAGTGQWMIAAG